MKSETPRTDSQLQYPIDFGIAVDVNFARQLEHELNQRDALIRELLTYNLPGDMHEKLIVTAMPNDPKLSHADGRAAPQTR